MDNQKEKEKEHLGFNKNIEEAVERIKKEEKFFEKYIISNYKKYKLIVKKHPKKSIAGVILLLIILYSVFGGEEVTKYTSITTKLGTLEQTIQETGTVASDVELQYGWEKTGRVISIQKSVGQQVKKGDVIAILQNSSERNALGEAVARLNSAQAQLDLKFVGVSDQEKQQSQANVDQYQAQFDKTVATADLAVLSAKRALETAENNLQKAEGGNDSEIVEDAYNDLVNSLKSSAASIRSVLTDVDAIVGVDNVTGNDAFENQLGKDSTGVYTNISKDISKDKYIIARDALRDIEENLVFLTSASSQSIIDNSSQNTINTIKKTEEAVYATLQLLDKTEARTDVLSQDTRDSLVSSLNTAYSTIGTLRTTVINSIQAVTSAKTSLTTYEIAYQKALSDLVLIEKQAEADKDYASAQLNKAQAAHDAIISPPRDIDVASLQADIQRLRIAVATASDNVNKTILRALADGVIANIDIDVGELFVANTPVVSLVSKDFSLKVDISESDIVKVKKGQRVTFTLDAYGRDLELTGTVSSVYPAEKEISGVIYYETVISLDDYNQEEITLKPGMTANITIHAKKRENVIAIPQRAVLRDGDRNYVRIVTNKKKFDYREQEVQVGIRGDEGQVVIISGLKEGQEIITFISDK